jgi:hypothetical protein
MDQLNVGHIRTQLLVMLIVNVNGRQVIVMKRVAGIIGMNQLVQIQVKQFILV